MEPLVEAKELRKEFGGVEAVRGISFSIARGEIVGIVGPNGAGKTTTLQMILGLTTQTSGEIRLFGRTIKKDREYILSRVNFSSSYISLPYSLTVWENMMVFARLYNVRDKKEKITEVLRTFEICDIRDEPTRSLSSGQITRVCLAKAMLNDPEVLFLDEPTASLDPDIADKTRTLLKKFKKEKGTSILYTSHNMAEMEELCDRVLFLEKGVIIAEGSVGEIKNKFGGGTLEEVFLKVAREGSR